AEITSTGTGVSTAVREVRAPTTTTAFNDRGVAASLKSAVTVCPAATVTRCSAASYPMSRARTVCAPAGTLRRYCPLSLVSTLRTVPTITTLAPTSGVPDWAATVPATVPVCWAALGSVTKHAVSSGRTRCDLTVHLLEPGAARLLRRAAAPGRRCAGVPSPDQLDHADGRRGCQHGEQARGPTALQPFHFHLEYVTRSDLDPLVQGRRAGAQFGRVRAHGEQQAVAVPLDERALHRLPPHPQTVAQGELRR